jgi:hypothetical protein
MRCAQGKSEFLVKTVEKLAGLLEQESVVFTVFVVLMFVTF